MLLSSAPGRHTVSSLLLFVSWQSLVSAQFRFPLPDYRYVPWIDLPAEVRFVAGAALSYTEDTWNLPGSNTDVEGLAYGDLIPSQQSGAETVGFDEETWDCWVNHYEGYFWTDFAALGVQQYWEALGWSEASWNEVEGPPLTSGLPWQNLTEDEQLAANALCFFEDTWNGDVSLPNMTLPVFVVETVPPTPMNTTEPATMPPSPVNTTEPATMPPSAMNTTEPATMPPAPVNTTEPATLPPSAMNTTEPATMPPSPANTTEPATMAPSPMNTTEPTTMPPSPTNMTELPTMPPSPMNVMDPSLPPLPMNTTQPTPLPSPSPPDGVVFPFALPEYRYVEWTNLPTEVRSAAETNLSYTEDTWNLPGSNTDLEALAYGDLIPSQQGGAQAIGFDEDTWDCWVNHYTGYFWSDLALLGVQQYWEALGWTEESWNGDIEAPPLPWQNLTEDQQTAANSLCYFEDTWNADVPLANMTLPVVIVATPSPSPAPVPTIPSPTLAPSTLMPATTPPDGAVFRYDFPEYRYEVWTDLPADIRNAAVTDLGYTEETWNLPGNYTDVEGLDFSSLTSVRQEGAVKIGFDQETWDCWVNHYAYYTWRELREVEVQGYWETLGWTQAKWNEFEDPPATNDLFWAGLNEGEQAAAYALCYFEDTWNGNVTLADMTLPFVTTLAPAATVEPTEAPSGTGKQSYKMLAMWFGVLSTLLWI